MMVVVTGTKPAWPHQRRRALAFGAMAWKAIRLGMDVLMVSPTQSLSQTSRMSGWRPQLADRERWLRREDETFAIEWVPTRTTLREAVVYDGLYLKELRQYRPSIRRFFRDVSKHHIPVFNPRLPSKDVLFQRLGSDEAGHLVPQSWYTVTPDSALTLLDEVGGLWLKPVVGSGGNDMVFIHPSVDGIFRVSGERMFGLKPLEFHSRAELEAFLQRLLATQRYFAQEHLSLVHTKHGRKTDFRVTLARNETGTWQSIAVTARIATEGAELTNYHAGADIVSLTSAARKAKARVRHLGIHAVDAEELERIGRFVAERLTLLYPRLGYIGVDVGQTEAGEFYVFDCNSRPGRDILTDDEMKAFMRNVSGFGYYLQTHALDTAQMPV